MIYNKLSYWNNLLVTIYAMQLIILCVFNFNLCFELGVCDIPKSVYSSLPEHSQQAQLLFTKWHFPRKLQPSGKKTKNPVKRCYVCSRQGKRRESTYWCEDCNIGLCVTPCFEKYHTSVQIYQ